MLKKGQVLYIRGEKNVVINMIEFKEKSYVWEEYEIVNQQTQKHTWLSVEKDEDDNSIEYYVYEDYNYYINEKENEFISNNKTYKLYESGTTYVKNYFGNADVDLGEKCNYKDFMCDDDKTIISVENWAGEREVTIGYKVEQIDIRIMEEYEQVGPISSTKKATTVYKFIGCVIAALTLVIIWLPLGGSKNSIRKYLKTNNSKYNYVTSVTNNENNKKAQVYMSSFETIDETVKDIINGVPEGITKTKDLGEGNSNGGIGLETSKEYAYIYMENNKVYVQVSEKKYVENSGTTYHSSHYNHYYRTYRTTNENSTYKSYAASARQSSINSRKSSGGGTSSGK